MTENKRPGIEELSEGQNFTNLSKVVTGDTNKGLNFNNLADVVGGNTGMSLNNLVNILNQDQDNNNDGHNNISSDNTNSEE